ncbi:hypothetical protein [Streptomyces erythrochromogenes]|uniref:hypothetical protein n=1 Tax=Streptomyces erythrochromogenes TaxID=285574 RepID=UPI0038058071
MLVGDASNPAGGARARPQPSKRPQARVHGSGRGHRRAGAGAGVIGIGLAAGLTFALAQGSWQWFATYIGVTLFAVVFAFQVRPVRRPGIRTAYMRALVAYALVVGLCAAIVVAPVLQRWEWLFPMPGTRSGCEGIGRYEVLSTRAAVAKPAGSDAAALAYAQESRREKAVAGCLASTTTLWLPLYGVGAAVLVGAGALVPRPEPGPRRRAGPGSTPQEPVDAGARQADPA